MRLEQVQKLSSPCVHDSLVSLVELSLWKCQKLVGFLPPNLLQRRQQAVVLEEAVQWLRNCLDLDIQVASLLDFSFLRFTQS